MLTVASSTPNVFQMAALLNRHPMLITALVLVLITILIQTEPANERD